MGSCHHQSNHHQTTPTLPHPLTPCVLHSNRGGGHVTGVVRRCKHLDAGEGRLLGASRGIGHTVGAVGEVGLGTGINEVRTGTHVSGDNRECVC